MDTEPPPSGLTRAIGALHRLEDAILAALLGAMVVLAALQIGLREGLGLGLSWVDPLLRAMVLWLGLLGALAASREGRQITIDVLSRILPERARAGVAVLTHLATCTIAGLVAWHASRFVAQEFEFGGAGIGVIPGFVLASVIPFAFGAIAIRHLLAGLAEARVAATAADPDS